MNVLEVFAGTGSAAAPLLKRKGHQVVSVEFEPHFEQRSRVGHTWHTMDAKRLAANPTHKLGTWRPDIIWASPPCTAFSTAGKGSKDKTERGEITDPRWLFAPKGTRFPFWGPRWPNDHTARDGCSLVLTTFALVDKLKPRFWFLENPQGGLQTMGFMERRVRNESLDAITVTYCQYGERRMKPTRIVGRFPPSWKPRPRCYNGDPCHDAARRGAKTGTQALDPEDRGRIPAQLAREIWNACEKDLIS